MKLPISGAGEANKDALTPLFLIPFGVTIALWYWLLRIREGIFDPQSLPIYWHLVLFQDYWAALAMIAAMPLALLASVRIMAARCVDWVGEHQRLFAAVCVVALAVGAKFVYHAHPLSLDEYSAWLQGRVFASGHLTGNVPPGIVDWVVPERFQGRFINVSHATGHIASVYWPGFALLLAPFSAMHVPWLLNPLIAGAILLLVGHLAGAISGSRRTAGLAMLLAVGSQTLSINGISFYSMNGHLLVNLAFAALLLKPSMRRALAAGLVGSIGLTLHNPVPHLLFAAPWLVWILFTSRRPALMAGLLAGYAPLVLVLGLGWQVYSSRQFGADYMTAGHANFVLIWADKIQTAFGMPTSGLLVSRLVGLAKLWLWAVPGLPLLAIVGFWRRRTDSRVILLALSAAATFFGYMFVPFDQGHGWGFRYFQPAWGVLPILGAVAVLPRERLAEANGRASTDAWRTVAALTVLWMVSGSYLRAAQVDRFITDHLAQLPGDPGSIPAVRIVNPGSGYYAWDLVQNDPFLRGPVILVSLGREADAMMMAKEFPTLVLQSSKYRGQVWVHAQ